MTMTPARMAELKSVNRTVNREFKQRDDDPGLVGDRWELPNAVDGGDCEDLAIMKKAELLKRGWPASTLLLTVGTLNGGGHAVLTVRTSDGDLVLDNMTDTIKPWTRTPYTYYARQKPNAGGGAEWARIDS
jgi:predicted transglutaminase-like cysteine proteinase